MPNYESEVRKNLQTQLKELNDAYNAAVATDGKAVPVIGAIINNLNNLSTVSEEQYQTENGVQKALNKESFERLSSAYKGSINAIIRGMNDINTVSSRRVGSAERKQKLEGVLEKLQPIMDSLAKDSKALDLYRTKKEPVSFQQLVAETSPLELNIGKNNLGTVGAALSKRIPFNYTLPDGREVNGVFTSKRILDPRNDFKAQVDKMDGKYPGFKDFMDKYQKASHMAWSKSNDANSIRNFRIFLESVSVHQDTNKALSVNTEDQFREQVKRTGKKVTEKLNHNNIPERELELAYININKGNPDEYTNDLNGFLKQVYGNWASTSVNVDSGIYEGSRIDSRNTAMSAVADMLGVPQLLAKSSPMVIEYQGKRLEGTFMEKGKGMDYEHPTQDAQNYTTENFKSAGLKSLADLQVLDYLCGNTDRHMANMLYQFDTTGEAKDHKFIGVQGIDNDASFGEITGDFGGFKFPAVDRIGIISKSMADRIEKINRDDFKFALNGFGLSEAQREAAANRLDQLKDAIQDGNRYYADRDNMAALKEGNALVANKKLRVIADDQFAKLDPEKLPNTNFIYSNIKRFGESMKKKVADAKDLQTEKVNNLTGYTINSTEADKMEEFLKDMKEATGRRGTSKEFENLRDAVGKYSRFCKNVMDGGLTPAEYEMRMAHLKEIRNAGVEYMKHKGLVGENGKANPEGMKKLSSYAKDRVQLVAKISAESVDLLEHTDKNLFRDRLANKDKKLSADDKKLVNDFEQRKTDKQVTKAADKVKNDSKASKEIEKVRKNQGPAK